MRVLLLTCQPPHHMAPPSLGDEQINCGPWFLNQQIGDRWLSRTTPYGEFDVGKLMVELPADQYPDVVVCHVDCGFGLKPRQLGSLRCPVVLLAADSHWGNRALSEMIAYATSEPFSRVIILYDRHHLEFYRAAGITNVHWFPALTFPHPDSRVEAARQTVREHRLALVGKAGYHFRRQRLFAALIAAKLPLAWRQVRQADAIGHYGSSLIGINVVMNGDVNLRVFEVIAGGAMLLTDRLSADAGLDHLLIEGREKVSYADEREFVDRARYYLSHPEEARAIGDAGQRWFGEHFNEGRRRQAFSDLVLNGRELPEFATPPTGRIWVGCGAAHLPLDGTLACYDVLNELHRQQEQVTVQVDRTVPEAFAAVVATLPRTRLVRGAMAPGQPRPDLRVCGREELPNPQAMAAARVWCWDWPRESVPLIQARLQPAGWMLVRPQAALFQARTAPVAVHQQKSMEARRYLDAGEPQAALKFAQEALTANPNSVEACLVMAELAFEVKNTSLFEKMLLVAKRAEPGNPRIALLKWSAAHQPAPWQPARLLAMAWKAFESLDFAAVEQYAAAVLTADPHQGEAHYVLGLAQACRRTSRGEDQNQRERLGPEIESFRRAAERCPDRPDYWFTLAVSLAEAGAVEPAGDAFERAAQLEPTHALSWFGVGEIMLETERPVRARAAFARSLALAPTSVSTALALARATRMSGDLETAEREVEAARQLAPTGPDVAVERGRLRLEQGDPMGALAEVNSVLERHEAFAPGHQLAGEIALRNPVKPELAVAHFRRACALRPCEWLHHAWLGHALMLAAEKAQGAGVLRHAVRLARQRVAPWIELTRGLMRIERNAEALDSALEAADLAPDLAEAQEILADAAESVGNPVLARRARTELRRLRPDGERLGSSEAGELSLPRDERPERDLVICHVEINRLQGTGVLLQRFFGGEEAFVTLRSRTVFDGVVEFGGTHYVLDVPGLSVEQRKARLDLLLAPFRIRRILCVPFFAEDFLHGVLAAEITGAPMLAYVMDDQTLHATEVPTELARRLFQAARVRLTISPEMQSAYAMKFGLRFDLLPPILGSAGNQVPNHWIPGAGLDDRCAMVGNVWSAGQFQQVRDFARESGWKIDWFGNATLAHLPQDRAGVEADGIFCRGFIPEDRLAAELASYPFVLLPSGWLDGSEDNEWLTRLSIPSRMVFIFAQTHTPMLVLGSPETAAARLVDRLGLGLCAADNASADACARQLLIPEVRAEFVENAARAAPAFVIPEPGEWLWRSLEAGEALPTPLDAIFAYPTERKSRVASGDFIAVI